MLENKPVKEESEDEQMVPPPDNWTAEMKESYARMVRYLFQ